MEASNVQDGNRQFCKVLNLAIVGVATFLVIHLAVKHFDAIKAQVANAWRHVGAGDAKKLTDLVPLEPATATPISHLVPFVSPQGVVQGGFGAVRL